MKYTKQDVLEQRISFKPMTEEQLGKLCKHFKKPLTWSRSHYYRFYSAYGSLSGYMSCSYTTSLSFRCGKEISFEEFDFEDMKIGDPIQICGKEYKISQTLAERERSYFAMLPGLANRTCFDRLGADKEEFTLKTLGYYDAGDFPYCNSLEDLKKLVDALNKAWENKMKETDKDKKLVGYKLAKPEYVEVMAEIVKSELVFSKDIFLIFTFTLEQNSGAIHLLEKAGVLDLWFEPVYEEKEQIVEMGPFSLRVKGDKVYHNSEEITHFVKEMVNLNEKIKENIPKTYRCRIDIDKIVFRQTGCRHNETTLSKWIEVAQKANLL